MDSSTTFTSLKMTLSMTLVVSFSSNRHPDAMNGKPDTDSGIARPVFFWFLVVSIWLLAMTPTQLVAEEVSPEALPTALVTQALLESRIAEVGAATGLEELTRTRLLEYYRQALGNLRKIASSIQAADAFQQVLATAPMQIQAIHEEMNKPGIPAASEYSGVEQSSTLVQIEQQLQKEKAELSTFKARRDDTRKQLKEESGRPLEIRQRLTQALEQQEEAVTRLRLSVPADMGSATIEARQWSLETRDQALSAEIRMLDRELLSQPRRVELLSAELEQAIAGVELIDKRVKMLEELATRRRQGEADEAKVHAEVIRQEVEGKHPLVIHLAERNSTLSETIAATVSRLGELASRTEAALERASLIEADFDSARETIEIGGLSQELGHMLLQQRYSLPDLSAFRRQAEKREDTAAQIGVQRLRHRQDQKRLRDLDAYVSVLVEEAAADETTTLYGELHELAQLRQALLEQAVESDDIYLRKLSELESAQQRLLVAIAGYDKFLGVHLLWVRSASRAELEELGALPEQVWRILSPTGWLAVASTLVYQATHSPVFVLLALALGVLLWGRKRIIAAIRHTSDKLVKTATDHFGYSIQALILTLVAAAAWPLVMAVTGWQLKVSVESSSFSSAVGGSLIAIALQVFYLRGFRMICMVKGLAAMHFRWPEPSLGLLRSELDRLSWIYLPAAMVTIVAFYLDPLNAGWVIGRVSFLIMVGSLAFAFYHLLHVKKGVVADYFRQQDSRIRRRFWWLCYWVLVAAPLALGVLSLMGYLYTAGTLLARMLDTCWMIVSLVILSELARRWLRVTRRHLVYEAAEEQRREMLQTEQAQGETQGLEEGMRPELEEPEVDLEALSDTSRKLLNTAIMIVGLAGLWMIWSEVLSALLIFEDIALWNHAVSIEGETRLVPVTIVDIGLTLVYLVITVILVKQLPAVLEIILMHNSDMVASSRYTVTTLTTYAIVTVGIVLAFNAAGADWSKLQWLVASLGIGIGFGLQEIVANFISGIIILFERPVRVGDVVTVGDTDGTVTRIRIRATTIRNWDGKELLVPNKEFITGRLLNWSLSDQTTRLLTSVGIAYGSNVRRAMDLLEEVARENESILSDPAPSVIFQGFGDSALNMVLRCFVATVDLRLMTISALNEAINDKFNNAGITIAFPQQDLHLDTSEPLRIEIEDTRRANTESGNTS